MKGHFSKMCINQTIVSATTDFTPTLAAISDIASRDSLSAACMDILVNGEGVSALIDTFAFAKERHLKVNHICGAVSMASTTLSSKISGYYLVDIELLGNVYKKFELTVMEDLCQYWVMTS